ncbi:hypothetical protein D1BOALGB6SA_10243 [Olavius sp. associated proteobacterium Delta 1]|nr:hypothetical protein D1BOALGB6SA_10243 [Olavius sp. associated proteobacterium Delta 1]
MTVEGKVAEPFGPLVSQWFQKPSQGKKKRLDLLCESLGLDQGKVLPIRYQLLHRTASAIIEAKRFNAQNALMLVHTFSPPNEWFDDFDMFASLYNTQAELNKIKFAGGLNGIDLCIGWIKGKNSLFQQIQ